MVYIFDAAHLTRILSTGDEKLICSFFGHKDAPYALYPKIMEHIERLITQRNIEGFVVGNQGNFDSMVLKALRELKQVYPQICYNVALAYMPAKKHNYELYDPLETFLPEGIESVPKRFAISWRNKWMVRESDIILCYITHTCGGAAQFVNYARRQGKECINLFEGNGQNLTS